MGLSWERPRDSITVTLLSSSKVSKAQFFGQARIVAQGDNQAQFVVDCHYNCRLPRSVFFFFFFFDGQKIGKEERLELVSSP